MIGVLIAILVMLIALFVLGCAMCAVLMEIAQTLGQALTAETAAAQMDHAAMLFTEHLSGRTS